MTGVRWGNMVTLPALLHRNMKPIKQDKTYRKKTLPKCVHPERRSASPSPGGKK